jgi:hypothetical protein
MNQLAGCQRALAPGRMELSSLAGVGKAQAEYYGANRRGLLRESPHPQPHGEDQSPYNRPSPGPKNIMHRAPG